MSDEVVHVWVRNEKGQVYGPLVPTTIELLLDNGVIAGRVQVSLDGINYVFPGRMPGIRMVIPRPLWGDQVLPHTELDDAWDKVVAPPPLPTAAAVPMSSPSGAIPGGPVPGGPVPRPGAGAMAGPGARSQASARPMNPAQASAQGRPAGPPQARSMQHPAATPGTLEDSLFGDAPRSSPSMMGSTPSGVRAAPARPMSSASIAAAMGAAPTSTPSAVNASPAMASRPSAVSASPSMASRPSAVAPFASTPTPAPLSSSPSVAAVAPIDALPASGSLREISPQRLYFLAAAQDVNGLLTLQLPDRALLLHFRKGSPELIDSTHPEDALATFLLRQRLVTPEQLGQAQKEGARFGGELLPALFGLGLVNPNVAIEALSKRAGALVGQALLATEGTFTFQPVELPAHKAMPVGNRWQLYIEQLRQVSTAELKARMHEALDFPVMKAAGSVPVTELRLSAQETRAYAGFDGTRTLNQLFQSQASEADQALRVAFMLEPCDLVSFAGTVVKTRVPVQRSAPAPAPPLPVGPAPGPVAAPARPVITPQGGGPVMPAMPVAPSGVPAPPARPVITPQVAPPPAPTVVPGPPVAPRAPSYPAPPSQPLRPVGTAAPGPSKGGAPVVTAPAPVANQNHDAEVKRLSEVLAKMKTQNHFEVLALTKDSPANAVKLAYFKLAKDYHPDTVPPGAPEALARAKADIFARVGEAHRTLSDDALRKEYVAELEAGGAGEKIDVSKFLQADEFFQKGKILMQARKYADAFKMFDDCIAIMPDDAEVYAWRGYAKFFTFPDKKLGIVEAMKDINNCLKRNANVVAAHFHQGMMHRILGDMAAAKKHFSATVKLDPKHIDAQRELRMMK
ncbi:MAG: DnaJ domain-containing protein [Myxococcus sp.]|nr:DnaJ domain-containing protein [Myxococcus sp.]